MHTQLTNVMRPLIVLIAIFLSIPTMVQAAEKPELVFLNWSEYLDPELVKKFEEQYNVTVKEIYFESDDYRDNYILETQGEGVDLIMINGVQARNYKRQKWIVPITEKDVPNLKHIDKKWLALFEDAEGYAVPYFWGTSGIVYRKDLVTKEVTSLKDLLVPDESLRGKIAMVGASRDLLGVALKSLGYSINSTSFKELEEAKQLLLKQKPYVQAYEYISLDDTSTMVKGDVVMSMAYSGDALALMEHSEEIAYVVPEEGSEIWVDLVTVSKASKNKELAFKFIDFLNEPANAAQLAQYVYYASPNKAAEKLLPDDFKSDAVIYPSEEVIAKSETYKRLPPRVIRFRNEIFSRVLQ